MGVATYYGGEVMSVFLNDHPTQAEVVDHFVAHSGSKAALARAPLERAASSFHEVMSRAHCEQHPKTVADAHNQETLRQEFADLVESSSKTHFLPQMAFLVDNSGRTPFHLNHLGSTDDVQQELVSLFGLPADLSVPHMSGPRCGQLYKNAFRVDISTLPENAIRSVCKRYAVDYCCLGYEFPRACRDMSCDAFLR
jgi:hypothetical protein